MCCCFLQHRVYIADIALLTVAFSWTDFIKVCNACIIV